jgi:threonine synthase
MDISKASNFERFVFDLLGRDGARTRELFGAGLQRDGAFTLSDAEKARIAAFGFVSGRSTHVDRLATIRDTDARFGVVIDTHTADGLKVAREHLQPGIPMLVLETALPIKFAETIEEALGRKPALPAALADLESRPRRFTKMPADVAAVKAFIEQNAPAH